MNTPITDSNTIWGRACILEYVYVCESVSRRLETDRAALMEALEVMTALCRVKYGNRDREVWAEAEKAKQALANAHANFPQP